MLQVVGVGTIDKTGKIITIADITGGDNAVGSTKYSTGVSNTNRSRTNSVTEIVVTLPDDKVFTFYKNDVLTSSNVQLLASDAANLMPATVLTLDILNNDLAQTGVLPVGIIKVEYYNWYYLSGVTNGEANKDSDVKFTANFSNAALNSYFYDTTYVKLIHNASAALIKDSASSTNIIINEATYLADGYILIDKPFTDVANNEKVMIMAGYKTTMYLKSDVALLECFQPKIAKTSIQPKSCCPTCKGDTDIQNLSDIFYGLLGGIDAQIAAELWPQANDNLQTLLAICKSNGCNC